MTRRNKATFLVLAGIPKCTRAFGGDHGRGSEQALLGTPADSRSLWGSQRGTSNKHQGLTCSETRITGPRGLSTMLETLLSGSKFPTVSARTALGLQPSRVWQAWIPCLLSLCEGFWETLTSNANRSLIDICHISLLLCTFRVGKKEERGKAESSKDLFFHANLVFHNF